MSPFLILLLVVAFLMYIGGPLVIYFNQRMKPRPRFETLDPSQMPVPVAEYVYSTANALREAGFTPEAYLMVPDAVPLVRVYLIMMANREAGDKAMVTAILGNAESSSPGMRTCYLEFSTRYASGRTVDTMNSSQLSAFPALPHEFKTQLPGEKDPFCLYEIHRHVLTNEAKIAPNDRKVMYEPGGAVAYLGQVFAQGYEEQAAVGILRRTVDNDEEIYRPTVPGAFRMAWGLMFPLTAIRRMKISQRGNAVLESFHTASSRTAA